MWLTVACIKVKVPISPEVIYYKSHPRFLDHLLLCFVWETRRFISTSMVHSRVTKVFFGFGGRGKRVFSEPFASGSNKACWLWSPVDWISKSSLKNDYLLPYLALAKEIGPQILELAKITAFHRFVATWSMS